MIKDIAVFTVLVAVTMLPLVMIALRKLSGKKAKYALITNIVSFFSVCALFTILTTTGAFAAGETATAAATAMSDMSRGLGYIAAGLAVGIATIASAIAVGPSACAAIGALSEDPKTFGKSLIFVAFGEGIALYGMLIAFIIVNKL